MKQKIVCVSYIPTSKRIDIRHMLEMSGNDISNKFDTIEPELPKNCVIFKHNNKLSPIFIIDRPKEIWDNSVAWSENNPQDWFYCGIRSNKNEIVIALFPNVEKSLERFKKNQQLLDLDNNNINIIYHPIGIKLILPSKNFDEQFDDKVDIGFSGNLNSIRSGEVYWLNNIPRSNNIKYISKYLADSLQKLKLQENSFHQ